MNSRNSVLLALSTGMILGIVALPFLPKAKAPVAPRRAPVVLAPVSASAPLAPAALALAKSACVDSADGFLAALSSGDQSRVKEFLTAAAALGLATESGLALDGSGIDVFEVGQASLKDGEGRVPVAMSIHGQMQYLELRLREEGAGWNIYGASLQLGDETLLIDFEDGGGALGIVADEMLEAVSKQFTEGLELASVENPVDPLGVELNFPGSAPVSVEFVGFVDRTDPQFTRVDVRVQNDSNKAISKVEVSFHYLDKAGVELNSFPHSLSGPIGFGGQAALALAGSEKVNSMTAFFMPDACVGVRIEVLNVLFEDQSRWTSK